MPDDPNKPADPQDPANQNNQNDLDIVDPDDLKHQKSQPPSVTGEESSSGSTPEEPMDIDEALKEVGKHGDEEGVKPIGEE